jgi:hypothetical protein
LFEASLNPAVVSVRWRWTFRGALKKNLLWGSPDAFFFCVLLWCFCGCVSQQGGSKNTTKPFEKNQCPLDVPSTAPWTSQRQGKIGHVLEEGFFEVRCCLLIRDLVGAMGHEKGP